jgi:hypothetical protein
MPVSCGDPLQPPPSRLDTMAGQYCACTLRLAELNQHLNAEETGVDSIAAHAFQEKLQVIQEEYDKVRDCTTPVISRLGALKQEEIPELEKYIAQKCPAMSAHRTLLLEMLAE